MPGSVIGSAACRATVVLVRMPAAQLRLVWQTCR
jgi:hypothetical protein